MTFHKLKTWPIQWWDVSRGRKRFEIRKDDRGFAVGDIVQFLEFVPDDKYQAEYFAATSECRTLDPGFTGFESPPYIITYVARSRCIPAGYCGFQFERLVEEGSEP